MRDQQKKGECQTENFSVSSPSGVRYMARRAKRGKWTVWDNVECKTVTVDSVELFRKKNAIRIADEMNGTTADSIPRFVGDKAKEKAKRQWENFIKDAEAAATSVADKYQQLIQLNEQHAVLYRKFAVVAEEMRAEIKVVFHFFAHKKVHEKLFGAYGTQDEWTQAVFGMTARNVRNHITPSKEQPLLPVSKHEQQPTSSNINATDEESDPRRATQDAGIEDAEFVDAPLANKKPSVPQVLANTRLWCAISQSPVDDSETWAKEDAVRRIVSWALSSIRQFTLIGKRQIVEEVIAKLRDEMIFETADAQKTAFSRTAPGKPRTSSLADLAKVGSELVVAKEEAFGAVSEAVPA